NGTATATVGIPTILESETGTYGIHPVVLDGCLQALGACFPKDSADSIFMPVAIKSFSLSPGGHRQIRVRARVQSQGDDHRRLLGHLDLYSLDGNTIGKIEGVLLQKASGEAVRRSLGGSKPHDKSKIETTGKLLEKYQNAEEHDRGALLRQVIRIEVSVALQLDAAAVDIEIPLNLLGVDSLMAVELKNRMSGEFQVEIPLGWFMEDLNISEIADKLNQSIQGGEQVAIDTELQMVEGEL
ncbi:MAG: hypothetical protein JWM04_2199, partial [Verrucomicrobiales bacterium]|nr:hypothetical protein [Verrucomicrobiales bacterium]